MRRLNRRSRRLFGLYMLLFALSAVYVILLAGQYRSYLADRKEHPLSVESNLSLPAVGESPQSGDRAEATDAFPDNTDSDSEQISGEADVSGDQNAPGEANSSGDVSVFLDQNSVVMGDSNLLSLYSYDASEASCYTSSGISIAGFCSMTFDVPDTFANAQDYEQILRYYSFDSCYLFFGLYEADWYYTDAFLERYETLLSVIRESQPEADIYLHGIPSAEEMTAAGISTRATDEEIEALNQKLALLAEAAGASFVN